MPPPSREICDSEDEDDMLSPPPESDARVATFHRGEIVPVSFDMQTSDPSTSSTGEQLRQAHLDLMAPTQQVPSGHSNELASSASPRYAGAKRRLTDVAASQPATLPRPKRVKTSPTVSSQHPSNGTIPGPTFPDPSDESARATGDTIPGQTFPDCTPLDTHIAQVTSSTAARNVVTRQTPPVDESHSSHLTPWSISAAGDSSAQAQPSNGQSSAPAQNEASGALLPSSSSQDDFAGFPIEAYKPRPSRSRSEGTALDAPVDYSVVPEKAGKLKSIKSKRSKTIAHSPVKSGSQEDTTDGPKLFPDHPILQAPEFEALSPPLAGIVYEGLADIPCGLEMDQNLPLTVDGSTGEGIVKAPTAAQAKKAARAAAAAAKKATKATGKRGRPRKISAPDPVDDADELGHDDQTQAHGTKCDIQVVIAQPSPQANSKHDVKSILHALNQKFPSNPVGSSRPTLTVDEEDKKQGGNNATVASPPENVDEDLAETIEVKVAPKRRGRPKAATTKAKAAAKAATLVTAESEALAETSAKTVSDSNAVNVPDGPIVQEHAPGRDSVSPAETHTDLVAKTPMTAEIKGAAVAKSSPLPGLKGGPRYRVGLSRTQRMPSLLKVMRK